MALAVVLIGGCGPTFEAEYHAAQQELERVKRQLADAQQKLGAADNESRGKIYSLARRANTLLLATPLDNSLLSSVQQEMVLLADRYAQLHDSQDLTALTAGFYADKLSLILELNRGQIHTYEQQHKACLADLESQDKRSELSSMLCEVQADAAARQPRQQYLDSLATTLQLGKKLLDDRHSNNRLNRQELDRLFNTELDKLQQP